MPKPLPLIALALFTLPLHAQNWNQGAGPNANYQLPGVFPTTQFSLALNFNIAWAHPTLETGQSTVTSWGNKIFYTTLVPVKEDAELGSDIIAYCASADTGEVLWKQTIPGDHPLRLSGCFSDSSAPPAVTDGQRVVFFNASGTIRCYDMDGAEIWSRNAMAVGRSQPFLVDGAVVFTLQKYMPTEGKFTHEHGDLPPEHWTNLQALNIVTGEPIWATTCGVNMGAVPMLQTRGDGKRVILVGRGGGHNPPERPEGVSLVDASNGATLWTLPLDGFMSTMTFSVRGDHAYVFHADDHLTLDAYTGKILRATNFLEDITVLRRVNDQWTTATESLPPAKKGRAIIQGSNLLVGNYHYFRSYTHSYLGRINIKNDAVEYIQLPMQALRVPGQKQRFLWDTNDLENPPDTSKKGFSINQLAFAQNDMINNNGFVVMGDKRSQYNGWGHYASQAMTAIGPYLYVPTLNGTVYSLRHSADRLNENALIAVNDLGPAGKAYNRAAISYANGALFAHTMNHLIKIQAPAAE
ncbi:MAG: outer membrane protein assembly factor BamB family protein [Planctomycetota bacterium]|jgi:outer membrane protein assembly factor BamB